MSSTPERLRSLCMMFAVAAAVTACGGGGSDEPATDPLPGPAASTSITGTAAVGLPLTGTVTVKDAAGTTRQSLITAGSYTIDVSGLTAPFVFRAEGYAGGHQYVVHSAAAQADVGGTINITPLTDLVLSNIAGQVAEAYFDNPGNSAGLTTAALTAEAQKLRERLAPVLAAMGVDASIDLLRTPFTPLASALDKAIDVLRVDYAAGVATITNVVTQQAIQDSITVPAAQETSPQTMDNTSGVASSASDIDQIRARLTAFSNLYASGLPSPTTLAQHVSSDFLFRDKGADDVLVDFASFAPLDGSQFTDVVIRGIDYSNPSRPVASISFLIKGAGGKLVSFEKHWKMVKDGGQWLLHGDQRTLDIEIVAFMHNSMHLNKAEPGAQPTQCRESGFSLIVEDPDTSNSADVSYVIVTGPGLPQGGVRLNKPQMGGHFTQPNRPNNGNFYALTSQCDADVRVSDSAISAIPANAEYTITAYSAQDASVATFNDIVPARPLTLAELPTSTDFPTISGITFPNWSTFSGGTLNLTLGGLNATGLALVEGFVGYSNDTDADAEEEKLATDQGTMSASLTLPAAPGGEFIQHRTLEVTSWTNNWREFATRWVASGQ